MIIKTKDFILRPIKSSDAQGYLECHQDEDAKKNFMNVPKNLKEARKEISESVKDGIVFAIEIEGKFAGFVHLEISNKLMYKHSAIIGLGLHRDFRGRGIATNVLKVVTNYGFEKLKLKRISGMCRTFNKASARMLEKSGYKLEGILIKNKFKDGKYLDDMIWAKVK
jgi:RimJ/RimL family protein N-acetyltransferase